MRESGVRLLVYGTGLATLGLLLAHLAVVFLGPGGFHGDLGYDSVRGQLAQVPYFVALGALLVLALTHGWLGLRRTLLDAHVGPHGLAALTVVACVTTGALLYLYVLTWP